MKYDITTKAAPKMPNLGKGTECIKLLTGQTSKDMHEPVVPLLFPPTCSTCMRRGISISRQYLEGSVWDNG